MGEGRSCSTLRPRGSFCAPDWKAYALAVADKLVLGYKAVEVPSSTKHYPSLGFL